MNSNIRNDYSHNRILIEFSVPSLNIVLYSKLNFKKDFSITVCNIYTHIEHNNRMFHFRNHQTCMLYDLVYSIIYDTANTYHAKCSYI